MLDRLAGNTALKAELGRRAAHRPAAACGAAHRRGGLRRRVCRPGVWPPDYLYPRAVPHAEPSLKQEDTECLVLQGEGASGQIPVKRVREMREAIQHSALSTDAAGRVLFIYGAQNLNGSSANAMLKIIEEPPEGVLFLLTATSAATVLPTIRSGAPPTPSPRCPPPTAPPCCGTAACPPPWPTSWPSSTRAMWAMPCGPSGRRRPHRPGPGQGTVRLCGPERYLPRPGPW